MPDAFPKRDHWIPWAIVAFFVFFAVLLSSFAWIAFHSYTGEVTENAYKKGLTYNVDIAHADTQARLGWKGTLDVKAHNKIADITFMLRDAAGHIIGNAEVLAYVNRPTQAGHDQTIPLTSSGSTYRGTANLEWKGVWNIRISATKGNQNYQQSKTIVLQ